MSFNISDVIYLVDLNEADGDLVPVSVDYTVTYGPGVVASAPPALGQWVTVHYDDDNVLMYAEVVEVISGRDFRVRIDWDSCSPVLNEEWGLKDGAFPTYSTSSNAQAV